MKGTKIKLQWIRIWELGVQIQIAERRQKGIG